MGKKKTGKKILAVTGFQHCCEIWMQALWLKLVQSRDGSEASASSSANKFAGLGLTGSVGDTQDSSLRDEGLCYSKSSGLGSSILLHRVPKPPVPQVTLTHKPGALRWETHIVQSG